MTLLARTSWTTVACAVWLVASSQTPWQPSAAAAQETARPELTLTDDLQAPGNSALISLSVRAPEGVSVGKVVSEISYRGDVLLFQEAIRGLSAEAVGAEVSAVARLFDGQKASVEVTITAKPGTGIPNGVVADLRFKVADEAPAGTTVTLAHTGSIWSGQDAATRVEPVTISGSKIEISATAPLPACFFYMH